ncbi:MAG: CGNR zinc finger domain-containing protein [Candidatus Nanopelagicales bacterium]
MVFAPDTREALGAAVDLANSAEPPDTLTSLDALLDFYDKWGYTGSRPDIEEFGAVKAIRPRVRELLTADRDTAVTLINAILTQQKAVPQLVRHDHLDWHIHAISDDRPMHERVLVETAMAMVDVVRADEMGRLQVCGAQDCNGIVLDLSRNRSRRFCSTTCGNREAQAAYRARKSG